MKEMILKFDMSDHFNKMEALACLKASDLVACLWDLDMRLRETDKFNKEPISREEFHDILNGHSINLEELSC